LNPKSLSDKQLLELVNVMKNYKRFRSPTSEALSPLGEEVIKAGLKRIYEPEFVEAVTRKPSAYQGHPFIVEVGIAYGGKVPLSNDKYPTLLRYANKIPLLYDEGSDVTTDVVKSISWEQYLVKLPAPIIVLVHICSTKVPFKGVGKESIADVKEIRSEVKLAIQEVARKLRAYLSKKLKEEEKKKRVVSLAKYVPEVVRALTIILGDGRGVKAKLLEEKLVEIVSLRTGIPKDEVYKVVKSVEIGV